MRLCHMKNTGVDVNPFGFGCMRLPVVGDSQAHIDEVEATRLLHMAIERGVNYVDTAYPYHAETSEDFVGRALANGFRPKVQLATKLPTWAVEQRSDFDRFLNEQLKKLQTDCIDFYLVHALKADWWDKLESLGVFSWMEEKRKQGKIRFLGFSFHDEFPVFEKIIASHPWDFCLLQYNFMDVDYQAGEKGVRLAAANGVDVIAMEPLRGGRLTRRVPPDVRAIYEAAQPMRTPAEWALRWVWNDPDISLLLSGVSCEEHLVENLRNADESGPDTMTSDELDIIRRVRAKYNERERVGCTRCGYCMPCPAGVAIPTVLELYGDSVIYDDASGMAEMYNDLLPDESKANRCTACGQCMEKCPQSIDIITRLKEAHTALKR